MPRLAEVLAVADILTFGGDPRQYRVLAVSPTRTRLTWSQWYDPPHRSITAGESPKVV